MAYSNKKNPSNFPLLLVVLIIIVAIIFKKGLLSNKTILKPSVTPTPVVIKNTPYLSTYGTKIYLNGKEYRFTGVNAYHTATLLGVNAGCGGHVEDLDLFFSKLRPNSVVRTWAFQGGMATNVNTKLIDWAALDRVVLAAEKNQIRLILVLGDQSGNCDDGHWKDRAWYEGGYKQVNDDLENGLTPLPYLEYVKLIVERYKDSKTIAMWEPMNEPESSDCKGAKGSACYTKQSCKNEVAAAKALRSFFDVVGGTIKSIDSNHIVSSGVIGDGQCGAVFEDYKTLHESPEIDVASFHDYNRDDQAMPGDEWNGLQKRLNQMKIINKPLIVGEVGMLAMDNSKKCMNYAERRDKMKAKMDAQFKAGIVGFLPWALTGGTSAICNYDIVSDDPLLDLLNEYEL
jgi:hypothetical protein